MAKTVVGLFNTRDEARDVIEDLVGVGFNRSVISMMARNEDEESGRSEGTRTSETTETEGSTLEGAGKGAAIGGAAGLALGLAAFAIPGIGPIVAAGPLATALAGLGIGAAAGGIIGALANIGVPEEHAYYYAEGVRRGGVLVHVNADETQVNRVTQIMRQHGAMDIEKRAERWRERGWSRFDDTAQPLTREELLRERESSRPIIEEDTSRSAYSDTARRADVGTRGRVEDPETYRTASEYAETMAREKRYQGRDWSVIENDVRSDWELRRPGTWDRFKEAVRVEWEKRAYTPGSSRKR